MKLPNNQGIFIEFEPDRILGKTSHYILPATMDVEKNKKINKDLGKIGLL